MDTASKVDELLGGMRDEESRLRNELSESERRTRELKAELKKVSSAIRALGGKQGAVKKGRKNGSSKARKRGAAEFSRDEVPASEMSFSD